MARLTLVTIAEPLHQKFGPSDWKAGLSQTAIELWAIVRHHGEQRRSHFSESALYILGDTINWLSDLPPNSIQAIVMDPSYGLIEYAEKNYKKLSAGRGGVWRIPPSFDGAKRQPLPRFTVLSAEEITRLHSFFSVVANGLLRALVPGGHVFIASNPLLSTMTFHAFQKVGFEKRGEIIRLLQTLPAAISPKELRKNSTRSPACPAPARSRAELPGRLDAFLGQVEKAAAKTATAIDAVPIEEPTVTPLPKKKQK